MPKRKGQKTSFRESTTRPRSKKRPTVLDRTSPEEAESVLRALLDLHPHLRRKAEDIAKALVAEVQSEDIADEVAHTILSIGLDALNSRAGRQPWGYVEPTEAAWELLQEAIEDLLGDMKRGTELGLESAAESICRGIVLGLYQVKGSSTEGALGWAPDFPAEAAAQAVSNFVEQHAPRQRKAAGKRLLDGLEEQVPEWMEMLDWVVQRS